MSPLRKLDEASALLLPLLLVGAEMEVGLCTSVCVCTLAKHRPSDERVTSNILLVCSAGGPGRSQKAKRLVSFPRHILVERGRGAGRSSLYIETKSEFLRVSVETASVPTLN